WEWRAGTSQRLPGNATSSGSSAATGTRAKYGSTSVADRAGRRPRSRAGSPAGAVGLASGGAGRANKTTERNEGFCMKWLVGLGIVALLIIEASMAHAVCQSEYIPDMIACGNHPYINTQCWPPALPKYGELLDAWNARGDHVKLTCGAYVNSY